MVDKEGHLIGIVTEGDFLRRAETGTDRRRPRWLEFLVGPGRLAEEYARSHARKVGEVMTADPLTVTGNTLLEQVVRLMEKRQINSSVVLNCCTRWRPFRAKPGPWSRAMKGSARSF